jgi:uncharacterized protein YbjT (DUF2867 family)
MTILVTGANGTVSSALVRELAAGFKVRALVRDAAKAPDLPSVEVAVGDLDEPSTLTDAFSGVDTVWLLTAMGPQAPHASMNAVWAARRAGVRHVVRLSAVGAGHDAPTRNGRLHALSDEELMTSGLAWTIVRPHFFMQNLLGAVNGDTLFGMLGGGRLGMVDTRDVALFGARILAAPQAHAGKVYTVTGSASVSMHEAAESISSVLGSPIRYQPVSPEDAAAAMVQLGFPQWVADVSAEYGHAYANGWGDFTTPDFTTVTGRPARSFAEFAADHRSGLRA